MLSFYVVLGFEPWASSVLPTELHSQAFLKLPSTLCPKWVSSVSNWSTPTPHPVRLSLTVLPCLPEQTSLAHCFLETSLGLASMTRLSRVSSLPPPLSSLPTSTCTLTPSFQTRWGIQEVSASLFIPQSTGLLATLAIRSLGGGCVEGVWEAEVRM